MSAYSGFTGQIPCPCFGRLGASPWLALAIDSAAVTGFVVFRPKLQELRDEAGSMPWPKLVPLVLLILGSAWLIARPPRILLALRGDSVSFAYAACDVGEGQAGERIATRLHISNNTSEPVQILGVSSPCNCLSIRELPIEVPAQQSAEISAEVTLSGAPGKFRREFTLYSDAKSTPLLFGRLVGRVTSDPAP